jgi:glycosyltransferase involved in cell wall biosynthesis
VRALATPAAAGIRCVIGGEGEELPKLRQLAGELGVADRITFTGYINDSELLDHLARCRAVVFVPKQEDFGFVTVEAFSSAKAVITATDSGGPTEFVRSGENGFVVAPEAEALGRACADMMRGGTAERMGAQGQRDAAHLTWAKTVSKLVIV